MRPSGFSGQWHTTWRRRIPGLIALVVVTGFATGASTEAIATAAFQPSFQQVPCPPGVTAEEGSKVSCGYLTVLENRVLPNGRTIRLFITKAEPLEGHPPSDPMFGPGPLSVDRDLGWSARKRKVGTRAGRVLYSLDERGTGYSEPNLSCPEVERLTDPSFGVALGTPEMETGFLGDVQACHDRLTASGIDLASYNLAAMAADAEDLRTTIGIEQWNLITWGTTSQIAFEIMRRYPEHVRSVVMDSPLPPQVDPFTQAVVGTEWAFRQVRRACRAQSSCHDAFPHLHRAWNRALHRLDQHPSLIHDEDLSIVVDDATAVRYLRNNLALGINQTPDISQFPLAVYDLVQHGWVNGEPAGNEVFWAGAPPFDVGVDIQWDPDFFETNKLYEGMLYSVLCHDEVPFIDQAALADAAGGKPWYIEAYVESAYPQLCERWDVGQADSDPHATLTSHIPTLLMVGRFDPFSPLPLVKRTVATLSKGWVLEIPTKSRNVLSSDCTTGIRTAFVDNPTVLPNTSCVADLEGISFVLPPPTIHPKPGDAVISTVAGDGAFGSSGDGNLATQAQLGPEGVVVDEEGNLYIVEADGDRVRRIDASTGRISTVIGPPTGVAPPAPGQASTVELNAPFALAIDGEGNLYVGGGNGTNQMIIRVDPSSGTVTTIAGTGEKGFSGDGGPATEATMSSVGDIAVDDQRNIYFSDYDNHRLRKVDTAGIITTIAGIGIAGFSGDGGPATQARLDHPTGVALDAKGRIYLADKGNHRVRRISRHGIITTIAGNGRRGYEGDGGRAKKAALGKPLRVLLDANGNLYITSVDCSCVRMVDPDGIISTIAGTGVAGFSGDGGPAKRARLSCCPDGMAFGPDGALYIADAYNSRVRKVVFP